MRLRAPLMLACVVTFGGFTPRDSMPSATHPPSARGNVGNWIMSANRITLGKRNGANAASAVP